MRLKLLGLIARCLGLRIAFMVPDRRRPEPARYEPTPMWYSHCVACGEELPFGIPRTQDGTIPERLMN